MDILRDAKIADIFLHFIKENINTTRISPSSLSRPPDHHDSFLCTGGCRRHRVSLPTLQGEAQPQRAVSSSFVREHTTRGSIPANDRGEHKKILKERIETYH
jgi:hypothetical protein